MWYNSHWEVTAQIRIITDENVEIDIQTTASSKELEWDIIGTTQFCLDFGEWGIISTYEEKEEKST